MQLFYQLIGFGATAAVALSYWQRDKRRILLWQIAANVFFALHYFLIGAATGGASSLFQTVVLLLFFLRDRYRCPAAAVGVPVVIVFFGIGAATYESAVSLLPIAGSLLSLLPFFQSNRTVIRAAGLLSALVWLVYVIIVRSYSGMVTESFLAVSTLIALIRNRGGERDGSGGDAQAERTERKARG